MSSLDLNDVEFSITLEVNPIEIYDLRTNLQVLFEQCVGIEIEDVKFKVNIVNDRYNVIFTPMISDRSTQDIMRDNKAVVPYHASSDEVEGLTLMIRLVESVGTTYLGEGNIFYFLIDPNYSHLIIKLGNLWFVDKKMEEIDNFTIDMINEAEVMIREGYKVLQCNIDDYVTRDEIEKLRDSDNVIFFEELTSNDMNLYLVKYI